MVKKRNEAGVRGLSPEGSAAEAKRMRRQTAKDDRARRRRTSGTPSRAQGVRQRSGGADRAAGAGRPKGCLFCCDQRSPGCVGRGWWPALGGGCPGPPPPPRALVPGDKSISHRAVMFASMAEGQSRIRGFLPAEDTLRTVGMMIALGVEIHEISPTEIRVNGRGMRGVDGP